MPDADHLKLIASLFHTSIDDLLDYKKELLSEFLYEEKYSLDGIKEQKPARSKEEQYIVERFEDAIHITAIMKKKKWSWKKLLFWFTVEASYSSQFEDLLENGIYTLALVEEKEKSYFVIMKNGTLKVYELKTLFEGNKLEFQGIIYKKIYTIK